MQLQVTLFDINKKYRPISTIVEVESLAYYESHKAEIQTKAVLNICHNRKITYSMLKRQGYTQVKARAYNEQEIEQQKEFRHKINLIKYYERKRQERLVKES